MKDRAKIYFRYFTYIKPVAKLPIIRTYGTTIFTIFVMIIFIFFAIKPTVETILILQKKVADSNQILQKLQEKGTRVQQGKEAYENLDPAIRNKIEVAIPDIAEVKTLIQTLENTAKKYEASVSALQIQPYTLEVKHKNQIGAIAEINFIFNIEGEYQNLVSILQDLKKSSRLISPDKITLTRLAEGNGVIMSITGTVWYLRL